MDIIEFFVIIGVYILFKECSYIREAYAMKRRYILYVCMMKLIPGHGTKDQSEYF